MSVFWLQPIAWWGLAALAIPVLIHLLARHQSRRVPFPSLRFLRTTRRAALSRRVISDWPLLIIRLLIIAAGVGALAAPVVVSSARREAWNSRVARAIVTAPFAQLQLAGRSEVERMVDDERRTSFVSAVFTPTQAIADGVREATVWLARQPPAAREIVIVGDLRAGSLISRDFEGVAPSTGIRLLPVVAADPSRQIQVTRFAESETEAGSQQELLVTLEDQTTRVAPRPATPLVAPVIELRAPPVDEAQADARLRAVVAEGVLLSRQRDRRVVIEFDGARSTTSGAEQGWMRVALEHLPDLRGGERQGALVVSAGMSATDTRAAHLIARVVKATFEDPLQDVEPRRIPAETLVAWTRPPGPVPDSVQPGNEGDSRFFWLAALALLALEHVLRRSPLTAARERATESSDSEARVA